MFIFIYCKPVNDESFTYNDLEYKYEYNALWVKVFYQNSSTGEYFNQNDIQSCNTKYKYSIMNKIEEIKTGKTYEFMLEYPQIKGYNRWTQTSSSTMTSEKVSNYTPIDITWSGNNWKGICKSNNYNTYLDGSVGNNDYWYSIGSYKNTGSFNGSNGKTVSICSLYARIDGLDITEPTITTNYDKNIKQTEVPLTINVTDDSTIKYVMINGQTLQDFNSNNLTAGQWTLCFSFSVVR